MMESHTNDTGNPTSDDCLSDLQLAALIDGSLKAHEIQVVLKHINRCSNCRFCWMEASAYVNTAAPIETPKPNKATWTDWLHKLLSILFIPPKLVAGIATVATMVFLAIFFLPMQNQIDPLLDHQYAFLNTQQHSISAEKVIEKMPLPWENAAMGFAPTHPEISTLAFAAGLWDSRNALSDLMNDPLPPALIPQQTGTWDKTEQRIYYQLGRWITSLWFASQFDGDFDWKQQSVILGKFNRELQSISAGSRQAVKALELLERIAASLKEIEQGKPAKDQLRGQLEITLVKLSPASLDE